ARWCELARCHFGFEHAMPMRHIAEFSVPKTPRPSISRGPLRLELWIRGRFRSGVGFLGFTPVVRGFRQEFGEGWRSEDLRVKVGNQSVSRTSLVGVSVLLSAASCNACARVGSGLLAASVMPL